MFWYKKCGLWWLSSVADVFSCADIFGGNMDWKKTAIIFIGYQNDYFASDGILRAVIEEADRNNQILNNTLALVKKLEKTQTNLRTN